jgi:hypothetical protein
VVWGLDLADLRLELRLDLPGREPGYQKNRSDNAQLQEDRLPADEFQQLLAK